MFHSAKDLAGNVAPTVHYNWTVNTDIPETVRGEGDWVASYLMRERDERQSRKCIDDESRMVAIMFVFACYPLSPFSCTPYLI